MKSAAEIAGEAIGKWLREADSTGTPAPVASMVIAAIEADRAQLREQLLDYDEWERLASDDEPAVRVAKIEELLG